MGCKCCKMIKSYIFHPQEVQTATYINEINNYKPDEEERRKSHCKRNSSILGPRSELQIAETQVAANQYRFHPSKDALWSSRIPPAPEKGLGNSVVKCSVNGIHNSTKNLSAPHHKTQPKEIKLHTSSGQQPDFPGKRVFQAQTGDKLEFFDPGNYPKQTPNALCKEEGPQTTTEPIFAIRCALPEIRDIWLDNPSFLPEDGRAEIPRAVGKENRSNHLVGINPSTGNTPVDHNWNPLCGGESDEVDSIWGTSPFDISFEDQIATEILSGTKTREPAWETRCDGLTEVNGELEEDAEVAEALAALEAATAGELFEEEEEEVY